ncbi:hypothetical protein [uncultured Sulfitobacter sp.]|uniref:hypothetical protein n=1 Tax=uncultured Sulfitobacter sp. TaxID=191468 RepID=UPI00262C1A93|nr:hypothetical protein [uncultured Sulfitobacter sp.]
MDDFSVATGHRVVALTDEIIGRHGALDTQVSFGRISQVGRIPIADSVSSFSGRIWSLRNLA